MIDKIKKRQEELSNQFLIVKNQISDIKKQLNQKEEQLYKIEGAIIEFQKLIQLEEAEID